MIRKQALSSAIAHRVRATVGDGSPEHRRAMAEHWTARLDTSRELLVRKLKAVEADLLRTREGWTGQVVGRGAEHHLESEDQSRSRRLALGGAMSMAIEVILTAYVSAAFLNFIWWLACLIGVLVAILLALLVKSALVLMWDPERPRASVKSVTVCVWASFGLSMGGMGALLVTRTVPALGPAADVALAVLSLSLPILAGSFFVLAAIYGRGSCLDARRDRLQERIAELDQLIRELKSLTRSGKCA